MQSNMYTKLAFILLLQFSIISAHRFGHEVGSTSMDSTHYDRRNQCSLANATRERFWLAIRSSSISNQNQSHSIPFRRQLITKNGEDRLVTRASSNTNALNKTIALEIDQAMVDIIVDKQISGNLTVYVQVIECLDCPYEIIAQDLSVNQFLNLTLNTKYTYRIRIELTNTSSCLEILNLYEHGQYTLTVQISSSTNNSSTDSGLKCLLTSSRSANNVYTPLIVGGVILITLFIFCIFAQRMKLRDSLINLKHRCCNHVPPQESTHSYDLQACPPMTTICQSGIDAINSPECATNLSKLPPIHKISHIIVPRSKRLLSLDAFRGFALIAMIFVNYGGGGYAQFEHSPWHGITFADVVFPLFVWILGASLVFSLKNALDKGASKRILLTKVAMRTLKLFIIGFILNTRFKVDLNNVRILGVLQRFAIVYGLIGTIEVLCTRAKQYSLTANLNNNGKHQSTITTTTTVKSGRTKRVATVFRDISNFPLQWLTIIGLTTIWVLVVYLVPYENCPAGYLGPGGLHENGKYENCTGGITNYIDRMILTDKHLYQYPTCQVVYGCKPPFDPENLLGVIPTTFLAYLGVQAGRILVMYQSDLDRLIRLFAWGIFTAAIGIGLTSGTLDGGVMPLNKNLWTLSFSFFTAGVAFVGFSIMYILIDKLKWWNSTPFQYPGTNSILIYIAHIVFASYFPVQWVVANTHAAHLAMALWGCIFWIIIAYIFFKKRVFLVL